VFAATAYRYPIQRSLMLDEAGRVAMLYPEHRLTRSQDLVPAYHDAGQFYWGRTSAWLADKAIFSERSSVVLLPGWRVQDIDDENDWIRAEYMFAAMQAHRTADMIPA
jgi:N-acylneuraminate cytidylyltransferase